MTLGLGSGSSPSSPPFPVRFRAGWAESFGGGDGSSLFSQRRVGRDVYPLPPQVAVSEPGVGGARSGQTEQRTAGAPRLPVARPQGRGLSVPSHPGGVGEGSPGEKWGFGKPPLPRFGSVLPGAGSRRGEHRPTPGESLARVLPNTRVENRTVHLLCPPSGSFLTVGREREKEALIFPNSTH